MADANTLALAAAARVMAGFLRAAAARYTREGAAAVHVEYGGTNLMLVRAGSPAGRYGWVPIQAWMLDDNGRHEAWGSDKRWYNENEKRGNAVGIITTPAVEAGTDPATAAFADVYVAETYG